MLPDASDDLRALSEADSVAVDPHKWLYAPLEAGCTLVRHPQTLAAAFAYHPPYYHFEQSEPVPNYYELGPQNSRAFRALKVWLAIRQAGRAGYVQMIGDDVRLARELFELFATHPETQAVTHSLSITTFRYVPPGIEANNPANTEALNTLNTAILDRLQRSGRAMVSNAIVDGAFVLRACIVNFRTTRGDLEALRDLTVELGRAVAADQRR
jgi:glutamate/tyrosine decarboxylase-like PLP-dependent enzyme